MDTSSDSDAVALPNTVTTAMMTTTTASAPESVRPQHHTGGAPPVSTSISSVRRVVSVEKEAKKDEAALIDAIWKDQESQREANCAAREAQ